MKHVYFRPWVGSHYGETKIKLLILGESHYAIRKPSPTFTIELTQEYADGEWNHRFWTQIMQVVTGKRHWEINKKEFWSNYAFYNYIQDVVAESAGIGPTQEMIQAARIPFFEVLEELKPSHILVLSKRLWESLPSDGERGKPIRNGDREREILVYSVIGHLSKATWVPHPSYGFSASRWHPWVAKFLER